MSTKKHASTLTIDALRPLSVSELKNDSQICKNTYDKTPTKFRSITRKAPPNAKHTMEFLLRENVRLARENLAIRRCLQLTKENSELRTLNYVTSAMSFCDDTLGKFNTDLLVPVPTPERPGSRSISPTDFSHYASGRKSPSYYASGIKSPSYYAPGRKSPGYIASGRKSPDYYASGSKSPSYWPPGSKSPSYYPPGIKSPNYYASGSKSPGYIASGSKSPNYGASGSKSTSYYAAGRKSTGRLSPSYGNSFAELMLEELVNNSTESSYTKSKYTSKDFSPTKYSERHSMYPSARTTSYSPVKAPIESNNVVDSAAKKTGTTLTDSTVSNLTGIQHPPIRFSLNPSPVRNSRNSRSPILNIMSEAAASPDICAINATVKSENNNQINAQARRPEQWMTDPSQPNRTPFSTVYGQNSISTLCNRSDDRTPVLNMLLNQRRHQNASLTTSKPVHSELEQQRSQSASIDPDSNTKHRTARSNTSTPTAGDNVFYSYDHETKNSPKSDDRSTFVPIDVQKAKDFELQQDNRGNATAFTGFQRAQEAIRYDSEKHDIQIHSSNDSVLDAASTSTLPFTGQHTDETNGDVLPKWPQLVSGAGKYLHSKAISDVSDGGVKNFGEPIATSTQMRSPIKQQTPSSKLIFGQSVVTSTPLRSVLHQQTPEKQMKGSSQQNRPKLSPVSNIKENVYNSLAKLMGLQGCGAHEKGRNNHVVITGEDKGSSDRVKSVLHRPVDTLTGYRPYITKSLEEVTTRAASSKSNRRLIGEIAFQLDRRILEYVFAELESQQNKRKRSRYYGYSLVNIKDMISKQATHKGVTDTVLEARLCNRLNAVLKKVSPFGYNINEHAGFTQDMVNKYGLMNGTPDKITIEQFGLNDAGTLRIMLGNVIRDEKARYDMLIILDCLSFLTYEDEEPMFRW